VKISVVGAGYVGLTTACCLAHIGHDVFCSESDVSKLQKLQNGTVPIFEPLLETVFQNAIQSGRLRFGSTEEAIDHGEAIFICVGTPPLPNGHADLSAIESVARAIAKRASGYRLVVEKSTVPVQTGSQLHKHLELHSRNGLRYDVASNPEFLREGSAVGDFLHPDRIVIGAESTRAPELLRKIYEPVIEQTFSCPLHVKCEVKQEVPVLVTDTRSAELIKHASNSFLAMKISFINMVSDLCEAAGADVTSVAEGMGLDSRIGRSFLRPGIGFGGFCFPKDLQAFVHIAEKHGCDFSLLKEVERINQSRVVRIVEKIKRELWALRGKIICVWGLAFKPDTDDVRFSPALAIVRTLQQEGARIQAYDPQAMENAKKEIADVTYCQDPYDAARGAEAIALLTEWDEFRTVDWQRLASLVERPLVIDGRNMLQPEAIVGFGFEYIGVGGISSTPEGVVASD
jgi:UDPglucose 6-dehydrogenase